MIPDSHVDLLERPTFAHVATIGPDGTPHSTPVWIDWDGEHVRFNTTTDRQKYRNLQRDPRLALSITDPDNPYRYLQIRGRVVDFVPDPDLAFINKLTKKYMDRDTYPLHKPGDERVTIVVEATRATAQG